MAKRSRLALSGHPHHVVQRGKNQNVIFVTNEDFQGYRAWLGKACALFNVDIHAYALMPNHVHLLLTPHDDNGIDKVIQTLAMQYRKQFEDIYQRSGSRWSSRYNAVVIEADTYLFPCYQYIEQNPLRSRLVDTAEEYTWSSFRYNAVGLADDLITPHDSYLALGKDDIQRRFAYRKLAACALADSTLNEIRDATNNIGALGRKHFVREVTAIYNGKTDNQDPQGTKYSTEPN